MILNDNLYNLFSNQAEKVKVDFLGLGLGYTVVVTSDGGIGIAYTYFEDKKSCMLLNEAIDYENRPASVLLKKIKSERTIERSMALALVNALNYEDALKLPQDKNNTVLLEEFNIQPDTNVAMVGYFGPLVDRFKEKDIPLEILDTSRGLGNREGFYKKLASWADVLLLTSTSILNNTSEEILAKTLENVKTAMLGPSTPMVAKAFEHLPVHMLAGTVPIEKDNILKAIRHGMGTPVLHKFSRKSYLTLNP
ncbi:MAG: DUF364 domain-containing protein [Desulfobacterales bacterium]|jgi:hypothetical protein|nr:DUF364 domain-containing protein [Desulfobacterales bacterium]MCK5419090.1 DUF364 domain-containing protein [Desulfobacterales bacterium]